MSGATPPAERPGAWVQSALTPAFDAPAPAIASRAIADVSAHVATGDAAIPAHADRQGGGAPVSAWQPTGAAAPARAAAGDGADIAAGAAASAAATLVNVYGESGLLLSATVEQREGFTVTAPPSGNGRAFSITESIDGRESAPVVVLDAGTLQNAVSAAHAQFAADGAIEVRDGQYLDLYTAGNVPVLDRPALVYDPSAHTVALDIPGQAPLPLIVLGASAPPETLDVSEILVRQAS
jgi:hypothetical protein